MDELDAIEERKVTSAGNGKRRLTERLVSLVSLKDVKSRRPEGFELRSCYWLSQTLVVSGAKVSHAQFPAI
jgi:hypothetical protein